MFGTAQRLRRTKNTDLCIGDEPLEKVQNYKYLGMWMDVNLNWHHHIDVMRGKIAKRLGVLRRVRNYLTDDLTTQLYNAMVLPLFDYCDTIYGTTDQKALTKLQRLQNRGAKTILKVPMDTSTQTVLTTLNWLPLNSRVTYHSHILMYKCLNGLAPDYLCREFNYVNHSHNTRYRAKQVLYVNKTKLEVTKRSFKHHGAINWNSLPEYCKTAQSLNVFKSVVLKHMYTTQCS